MAVPMTYSGSRRRYAQFAPMAEINVTPFVDVMLVLLIVFMIAAPLLTVGVPLELPRGQARALPSELTEPLTIHIDSENRIFIQSTEVADQDLLPRLRAIAEERGGGRIYVRADTSISYGRAMQVLGALNISGFESFGLVMDSGGAAAAEPEQ